jgi:hypothetical protein
VSTGQIDPTTVTPCPCYATSPTTQNRTISGEPPPRSPTIEFSPRADRRPPPPPPRVTSCRSPSLAGGPAPTASSPHPPASFPRSWASSPARPTGPNLLGPLSQEWLFLFSFLPFSHFHIYIYILMLIFYAPKIVQIFSKSQSNNTYNLTHFISQQCLMYCLLPIFARRRGIRPSENRSSGRRAGARPLGNRSFVPRELRRRQVHSSLDA